MGKLTMRGKLVVIVAGAKGLEDSDSFGKNDPYVALRLDENMKAETKVLKNAGGAPMWNEKFTFEIKDEHTGIQFRVLDRDSVGADDLLGQLQIPLHEVKATQHTERFYPLTNEAGTECGKIQLILSFDEYGKVHEGISNLKDKFFGKSEKKEGSSSSDEE